MDNTGGTRKQSSLAVMLGTLRKVWLGINQREERNKVCTECVDCVSHLLTHIAVQLPADLIAWRTPGKATDLSGKLDERIWGKCVAFSNHAGTHTGRLSMLTCKRTLEGSWCATASGMRRCNVVGIPRTVLPAATRS